MENFDMVYKYMDLALEEARKAAEDSAKDVPVGCIIVNKKGEIIGRGRNTRCLHGSVLGHAEINALEEAKDNTGSYLLEDAVMFVTLEPCPMCAGAIAASRVSEVYYGADNTENGACGTIHNLLYPHTKIYGGIKAEESKGLLKKFFASIRKGGNC
jgi:tRNA(adenine34) deaminase